MSKVPFVNGVERVVCLQPNNSFIPSTLTNIDTLFDVSLLSDAKFASWRGLATSVEKIGVSEKASGVSKRFIDNTYNISTPEGSVWMHGVSKQNNDYFLQTGSSVSIVNDPQVFKESNHLTSHGFHAPSVQSVDRCGLHPLIGVSMTYGSAGLIGKRFTYGSTSSKCYVSGAFPEIGKISKLTISLLLNLNALSGTQFIVNHGTNWSIVLVGSLLYATSHALLLNYRKNNISPYITPGSYFLLTTVFDGSQVDVDPMTQDAKRFKVYINDQQIAADGWDGPGHIPELTEESLYQFEFGLSGSSFLGGLDESRIVTEAWSTEEVARRYNTLFNKATYWTPKVQPVILSVNPLGSGKYQVLGSGFIVGGTDPTGTIGGTAFTIDPGNTDTDMTVNEGAGTPFGSKVLVVQNNETLSDNQMIDNSFHQRFSLSPWSLGL